MKYLVLFVLILLTLILATPALAEFGSSDPYSSRNIANGLVPCDGVSSDAGSWTCGAQEFFQLVENFLQFCVFYLAAPLTTVAIAYAGINMALHPDNPATMKEGKKIVQTAVIGLIWALGAYLIVTTLVGYFIDPSLKGKIEQYITIN